MVVPTLKAVLGIHTDFELSNFIHGMIPLHSSFCCLIYLLAGEELWIDWLCRAVHLQCLCLTLYPILAVPHQTAEKFPRDEQMPLPPGTSTTGLCAAHSCLLAQGKPLSSIGLAGKSAVVLLHKGRWWCPLPNMGSVGSQDETVSTFLCSNKALDLPDPLVCASLCLVKQSY